MRQANKIVNEAHIILGLLQSIERKHEPTHRSLASELGIALGLTNAYLKRCVNKGLLKVKTTPARRYAYFLTQRGFAEKARLTSEYLSYSLSLFRQARQEYTELLKGASRLGHTVVALVNISDLTEIATICAMDTNVRIAGIIDAKRREKYYLGLPLFKSFDDLPVDVDALIITEIQKPRAAYEVAIRRGGGRQILFPALLGLNRSSLIPPPEGSDT